AEQNEGLAYTTRVNCAETTITLCADKAGSHNKDYVKFNGKIIINQYLKYRTSPFLPQTSLW
ncbi:hypothetical protein POW25_23725, partial [Enterobacter roggenkampii]|uniref:hypothetical protein n=1 Tax=Enterobacter roggenkampii TaxID=1812935 RepID=UPI002FF800A5